MLVYCSDLTSSYSLNDGKEPVVSVMDIGAKDVKEVKDLKFFSPLDHFNPKWISLWKQTGNELEGLPFMQVAQF